MSGTTDASPVPAAADARDRGAVTVVVVLSVVALVASAALTVDLGRLMHERRELQLVADVAALDASRQLDDTEAVVDQVARVREAAGRSAVRNGHEPADLEVTLGRRTADGGFTPLADTAADAPDAVQVRATGTVRWLLQAGSASTGRQAVATSTASPATATIGVGSGLASVDSYRSVLRFLLGGTVALSAVSHQGLVESRIGVAELAQRAGVTVEELLGQPQTVSTWIDRLVGALEARSPALGTPEAEAVVALTAIRTGLTTALGATDVTLADLLEVDAASLVPSADATFDVASLATGALYLAREGRTLAVPALSLGIPSLTSLTATATVVEAPRYRSGPTGTSASTAQVRISAQLRVSLAAVVVDVPLTVEAASATATLVEVACTGGALDHVAIDVQTGLAEVAVPGGTIGLSLPLIGALSLPVSAALPVPGQAQTVTRGADQLGQWVRVGGATSVAGLAPALVASALAVVSPALAGAVAAVLNPVATPLGAVLDPVVAGLTGAVGLDLGFADVTATTAACPTARSPRLLR